MGPQSAPVHPVLACADDIEQALKDVSGVDPDFMRVEEKAAALVRLDRLADRVTALRLRVMAGAGEVADATADHSVATWLAAETRTDPRDRAGELALARALQRRWTKVGAAVADGSVNLPQARVLVRALEDLPEREVGPEALARAEEALVEHAATYAPGSCGGWGDGSWRSPLPTRVTRRRAGLWSARSAGRLLSRACPCVGWATAPRGSRVASRTR